MDISRAEQRILHIMAQGARIEKTRKEDTGKIEEIGCFTREGRRFPDITTRRPKFAG